MIQETHPSMRSMTRYFDEDLHGVEFRECDLTGHA